MHAFTDGRDTLPHAGAGYLARARRASTARASARSSAATGRWTATAAGSARSAPTTCSCTAARRYRAASGEQAVRDAYERGETDEFIEPTLVGGEARIRPGDSVICFNFRPDRMRQLDARAGRARLRRGRLGGAAGLARARRRAAGRARCATLTAYEEGWPYPVAFAPEHPATTLREVLARGRREPAARRRDREVPARHVLLQRRRGGAAARASAASWCPRRATCRPTTTSRR